MKIHTQLLSLVACLSLWTAVATQGEAAIATSPVRPSDPNDKPSVPPPEPTWGRIYLRRGLAPIQYFRDRYGGPMVQREVRFYFPRNADDRLGCALLPADEQDEIRAANGSIALVVDRGVCTFEAKSRLAEEMGAAALVVVSLDEAVKAPVATADKGEITIPTVMVRKTAGDMLRHISTREHVFGRLIPIVCERKPYNCKALTALETQYVEEQSARSGVVIAQATNETLGDFLTASFGGVLPTVSLLVPQTERPIEGCGELDNEVFEGKVALFSVTGDECSMLDKVSSAQQAGAVAALLAVGDSGISMKHPSVTENWHAYNITIASAAISTGTLEKLVRLQQQWHTERGEEGGDVEIRLEVRNRIADAWDEVRRLSAKAAWPKRKDRRAKVLENVLGSYDLDEEQLLELKHNYLAIAGGSKSAWDRAVELFVRTATPQGHGGEEAEHPSEIAVEPTGVY